MGEIASDGKVNTSHFESTPMTRLVSKSNFEALPSKNGVIGMMALPYRRERDRSLSHRCLTSGPLPVPSI